MILTNDAQLSRISIHKVGNKYNDEEIIFSSGELSIDDSIKKLLMTYFLSPFKGDEYFNLHHETDIQLNEVYNYVKQIFVNPESLYDQSINLAKHLYEKSTHQKINAGEFYVTYIKNLKVNGEDADAIGLFKSESKDTFLKIYPENEDFMVDADSGININKLDKGCLIFNTEEENGFLVSVVDKLSKATAVFWRDDFLKIVERNDSFHNTRNTIELCSDYIKNQLPKEFDIERPDQIDLLNKSADYITNNDRFMFSEYADNIIKQPEVIESFNNYKEEYEDDREIELNDSFRLSDDAAKKAKSVMKSIIKLDKNFHIYVHGKRELITKEYDEEKDMHYYKLYFDEES
jgi:hypothetical protein